MNVNEQKMLPINIQDVRDPDSEYGSKKKRTFLSSFNLTVDRFLVNQFVMVSEDGNFENVTKVTDLKTERIVQPLIFIIGFRPFKRLEKLFFN